MIKNIRRREHFFFKCHFFITSIFESLNFLKMSLIFVNPSLAKKSFNWIKLSSGNLYFAACAQQVRSYYAYYAQSEKMSTKPKSIYQFRKALNTDSQNLLFLVVLPKLRGNKFMNWSAETWEKFWLSVFEDLWNWYLLLTLHTCHSIFSILEKK